MFRAYNSWRNTIKLRMGKRARLKLSDIDVIECNEAFAVQNLAVIKELENQTGKKVHIERWNPAGGAIAFGHPNCASGAKSWKFAIRHLIGTGGRYGIFSACCGGGQGVATIMENMRLSKVVTQTVPTL